MYTLTLSLRVMLKFSIMFYCEKQQNLTKVFVDYVRDIIYDKGTQRHNFNIETKNKNKNKTTKQQQQKQQQKQTNKQKTNK